ncbi:hypothetical protein [Zavarzinella formosa]|uniref:hypothetical protein n=1 Tax=Zavarzinella formosa TaxID=360055 RepID=UPI0002DC619A|nr:hypothetical protein [Zavarzinella formosa]
MRHVCCVTLMFAACLSVGGLSRSSHAAPLPEKKTIPNDSVKIAETLVERFDIDNGIDKMPFKEVLAMFEERLGVTIIVDVKALIPNGEEDAAASLKDLENRKITIPAMKKVRGETVLKYVCDQVNVVTVIESDHIRITNAAAKEFVTGETNPIQSISTAGQSDMEPMARDERVRLTPTMTLSFEQKTLAEAVKHLADRSGRNIILSASARPQSSAVVNLTISNVPFETAAMSLAEAAGLRVVKQGNVVMMVSQERFKELTPPTQAQSMVHFQGPTGAVYNLEELEVVGKLMNGIKPTDSELLKREVEKLKQERLAAETSRKELLEKIDQLKQELGKKKP